MSFGDTLTMPLAGGNKVLPRISSPSEGKPVGQFYLYESTGEYQAWIRHSVQKDGKLRHNVEFRQTTFGETSEDADTVHGAYIVEFRDRDDADQELIDSLCDFVISGTVIADLHGMQA